VACAIISVAGRGLAAALLVALAGCSGGDTPPEVAGCTHQLSYWAQEALRQSEDTGFDYQEMGLSDAQNEALRVLVEQARRRGVRPAPDWVEAQAKSACARLARVPTSARGPGWP
jgi:hypothetical protein